MKLSRTKLYEMVWEKPMTQLAKEFGLSDVGLAKICRKHGIPLPERGYWARVDAGYKVPKKALTRKDYDPAIEIMDREPITEAVILQKKQKKEKQAEAVASIGSLSVPTKLTSPHRLTSMTLKFFEDINKKIERESRMKDRYQLDWRERAPIPDNGRYQCWPKNGFNLRVSMESLDRATCFLDTLVKKLEELGFKVQNDVDGGRRDQKVVEAVKDGEGIRFQLSEGFKQRLLTASELKKAKEQLSFASQWDRMPSSIFTFSMAGRDEWYEKKYVDGKKRIEDRLPEILAEFVDLVPRQKQARIDKAKAEEERREKERIRELARRRRESQHKQFDVAMEEAGKLTAFESLEAYLQRLEVEHKVKFGEIEGNVAEWFNVVRTIADRNNPLKNRVQYLSNLQEYDPEKIEWMPEGPEAGVK